MAHHSFAALLVTALALPAAALAQDTNTTGGTTGATTAEGNLDGTLAAPDCAGEFTTLDADANGYLSEAESPRDHARASVDGVTMGGEGLDRDQFIQLCGAPEAGAPFEGANSFTEDQARERALAWNVTDVTGLTLDDQGIWRGTGIVGGEAVSVAIDFKGNVVTTPDPQ